MYFTVRSSPASYRRITTYDVQSNGKSVFKVSFSTTQKPTDLGHFVRYTIYVVPRTLPYAVYEFRATLRIDSKQQTRAWRFAVVRSASLVSGDVQIVAATDGSGTPVASERA
jgi:hypothetical protein